MTAPHSSPRARRWIRCFVAASLLAALGALPSACSSPLCAGKCTAPDRFCYSSAFCGDGLAPCSSTDRCLALPAECNGAFSCKCAAAALGPDRCDRTCGSSNGSNYVSDSCG